MAIDDKILEKLATAIDKLVAALSGVDLAGATKGDDDPVKSKEKLIDLQGKELAAQEEKLKLLIEEKKIALEDYNLAIARGELDQEEIEAAKELLVEANLKLDKLQKETDLKKDQKKLNEDVLRLQKMVNKALDDSKAALTSINKEFKFIDKSLFSVVGLTERFLEGARETDKVIANLNKQGLAGVTTSLNDAQASVAEFGMSIADAGTLLVGLGSSNSTFRFETEETRKELLGTAAAFNKLGVDGAAFGELQATLSRNLNMNSKEVANLSDEFASLSLQTGKSVSSLVSDFNSAGDSILQFGSRATQVFMETQKTATRFGVSVNTVLGIFDKFDTVESAAETVGQLNAQFGTNIDQLQMLRAETPEERFNLLRESLEATGRSFSDLSRFEQKAMSQILGRDIGELQRVLGGGVELTEGQKGLKELADATMTIGDRIAAVYEQITTGLAEAGVFSTIAEAMTEAFAEGGPVDNFIKALMPGIISFGKAVSEAISKVISLMPVISAIGGFILEMFIAPIRGALNVFNGVFDIIKGIMTFDLSLIGQGLLKGFKGAFDLILYFFGGPILGKLAGKLIAKIGGMFSGMGSALLAGVKNAAMAVLRFVTYPTRWIISKIPGGDKILASFGAGVKEQATQKGKKISQQALDRAGGGTAVQTANLGAGAVSEAAGAEPALAKGGIIKPGTSAIVGDPLTPGVPRIERVTATSQGAMVQPMPNSGGGGGAQKANIVINIDGKKMGETIVDLIDGQYSAVLGG